MEDNYEQLELLRRIDETGRKRLRLGRICCALALAAVVLFACTLGVALQLVPQAQQVLGQVEPVLQNLEQATGQLAKLNLEGMVENVNQLVISGQKSLEQSMDKLNAVDFDALNQAIQDLSAIIEPLAKWAKVLR